MLESKKSNVSVETHSGPFTGSSSTAGEVSNSDVRRLEETIKAVDAAKKDIENIKKDAARAVRHAENAQNIAALGFFVIAVALVALVIDNLRAPDQRDLIGEIAEVETHNSELKTSVALINQELNYFKSCLLNGGWESCLR